MMALPIRKLAKILLLAFAAMSFYLLATHKHAEREDLRQAAVSLTPACAEKLSHYALGRGDYYRSPYVVQRTGASVTLRGYSDEDVRAIQRGCNLIDDLQGYFAKTGTRERWNADRFVRGT